MHELRTTFCGPVKPPGRVQMPVHLGLMLPIADDVVSHEPEIVVRPQHATPMH
jgi:hypothetical protein